MQSFYTTTAETSNVVPVVMPAKRAKPRPVDLVRIVRGELDKTGDPQRQSFLISLASDLLRRRQMGPVGPKPARRWR
jgi:hypothetical protein